MNYFKSTYDKGIAYSQNWYGTLDYAPPATVILYDDNEGYCIGYMESELPDGATGITEEEALSVVNNAVDTEGIFYGDKLNARWDMPDILDGGIIE